MKNFKILAAALAAMVALAACEKEPEPKPTQNIFTDADLPEGQFMITIIPDTQNRIAFRVAAKSATIHWGDGIVNTYEGDTLITCEHQYSSSDPQTIFGKSSELTVLASYITEWTEFNVSGLTQLQHITCYGRQIKKVDFSQNVELTSLQCANTSLSEIDIHNNVKLQYFTSLSTPILQLDVSHNLELLHLGCHMSKLRNLDISRNLKLTLLVCTNNPLNNLDVSRNINLQFLNCADNQLTSLDVSRNINLTNLGCYGNLLMQLDVSNCKALTHIACHNNRLSNLNVENNLNLESLRCDNNQLLQLRIANSKLSSLSCSNNLLDAVELNKLFNALPKQEGVMWIYGNPGENGCNKAIAIAKGWEFWSAPLSTVSSTMLKYNEVVINQMMYFLPGSAFKSASDKN